MPRKLFIKSVALTFKRWQALVGRDPAKRQLRLRICRYGVRPQQWPAGRPLRIAALADLHACDPWMPLHHIVEVVQQTNALQPDLIVLLGDYTPAVVNVERWYAHHEWAALLGELAAPLGVHAILGNHDWWDDREAQQRGHGPVAARLALEEAGIRVYENQAVRLRHQGQDFWLAGLADQLALRANPALGRPRDIGLDDLPATLAPITDDAPVILLAHEPDIFPQVPDRVALTLCGHTHGGQVRLFRYSPVVPSAHGNRYAHGHIVEPSSRSGGPARHLIVSGGLGNSIVPVRFGVPPEIVLIDLGG